MIFLFWFSTILLILTYIGYPIILLIINFFTKKNTVDETYRPFISLIIAAYNEEKVIAAKIRNSLMLNYPKDKMEIIIASDGSIDNTKSEVTKYSDQRIKFFDFPRAGKLATLNRVVKHVKGEIIIFTDANVMLTQDSLRKLVRHFADKSIGVVSGVEKINVKQDSISKHEHLYWSYEILMKESEGKVYSTIGACGPLYAIKRELYPEIPSHLNVCDDMTISLNAVQNNKRIVLERKALALEDVSMSIHEEWRRKKRIANRAWQSLFYHRNLLIPFKSPIAFQLLFHKVFRWLTLPLMVILFASNLFLYSGIYLLILIIQIVLYIPGVTGIFLLMSGKAIPSIISPISYFILTQCAQIVGLYNALFNKGKPLWQPIKRE